jgi:hypothetical protein
MTGTPIARERRHTLYFLDEIRSFSPVFLDTEVDMSAVLAHRSRAAAEGERYSVVTYVLHAAARALAAHPEANAALQGGKVQRYTAVNGKLTLDKTVNGRRVVLSVVLPDLERAGLAEVQQKVERYRDVDPATAPEFGGVRLLHRLPGPVGRAVFRAGVRSLTRRPALFGTFAVTSLGHRPVDGFHSVGGTTVTLGVGRILDRAVVRDGEVVVAPVLRLNLAFDHRVIDGAEAADVLTAVKENLEGFTAEPAAPRALAASGGAGNDVEELKQYIVVHARAQGIAPARLKQVLGRITHDDGDAEGSWTGEWLRQSRELAARGRLLESSRYATIARFPYVDGPARQEALEAAGSSFERWAATRPGITRLDVDLPAGRVRCWTSGLSATAKRPLLLVMGGIVSTKEQWGPVLVQAARMGMAGLVAEMPGVGENTLRYDADSWRMLTGLLDAVAERADTAATYAIALSFSGHLALRAAAHDDRIRGIITAGAPVSEFFTSADWQRDLPRITADTLAHLTGVKRADLGAQLADWALTPQELAALEIPVYYAVSRRDEIIPPGEIELLRTHVRNLSVVENDDVHGSPEHTAEMRLWTIRSLMRIRNVGGVQAVVLDGLSGIARTRGRLVKARGTR